MILSFYDSVILWLYESCFASAPALPVCGRVMTKHNNFCGAAAVWWLPEQSFCSKMQINFCIFISWGLWFLCVPLPVDPAPRRYSLCSASPSFLTDSTHRLTWTTTFKTDLFFWRGVIWHWLCCWPSSLCGCRTTRSDRRNSAGVFSQDSRHEQARTFQVTKECLSCQTCYRGLYTEVCIRCRDTEKPREKHSVNSSKEQECWNPKIRNSYWETNYIPWVKDMKNIKPVITGHLVSIDHTVNYKLPCNSAQEAQHKTTRHIHTLCWPLYDVKGTTPCHDWVLPAIQTPEFGFFQ